MTNTKTLAIASLLAVTLTSSAFAGSLYDQNITLQNRAHDVQTSAALLLSPSTDGSEAYAQAPAQQRTYGETNAERRAFDRATEASLQH